ncbi:MAG: asparagine--tRNA ligase, partial [Clostridia bacterium]|nr:asparagine--tRNA ligase [Clostridia bacterium]
MERITVKEIFTSPEVYSEKEITVAGWARTIRASNAFGFIELNDGSYFTSLQIVFEASKLSNYDDIAHQNVGCALVIRGKIILTPEAKQPLELHAEEIAVEGPSTPDYPLQKKRHSVEFLREIAHLRPRTNMFSAVFRVRSVAAYAIHKFFNDRGFVYAQTPLITASDCEGAGEMFRVTTLDLDNIPRTEDGAVDFSEDFFCRSANLTVSGQLSAETFAMAFGKTYTFGPTFRAEKSFTARHAAEFWMVELEIAFADLSDDMALSEDMMKFVVGYIMENCPKELEFFNKFVDNTLLDRLNNLVTEKFGHVTYTEAIKLLEESGCKFDYPVKWGIDLQTEHERYLTEVVYKKPI